MNKYEQWASYLEYRMNTDHDNVLLIDGYEGTGKSTLALNLMDRLTPDWQPSSNVIYTWRNSKTLLKDLPRKTTILMDEGANLLFSRDAMSRNNRWFGKLLFQCRQLNNTLLICIPNKRWLDSIGREHRAQYWIHNHQRGRATVLERRENWYEGTVWYAPAFDLGYPKYPTNQKYEEYLQLKLEAMIELGDSEAPKDKTKQDWLQENNKLMEAYT